MSDSIITNYHSDNLPISNNSIWKIIIADDQKEVHLVTRLVLQNFTFDNRDVEFLSTYSAEETIKCISDNPDAALLLLDMVMEKPDSGLDVIKTIRNELKNPYIRIILRTGQPGTLPQKELITDFDINDYAEKTDLSEQKLYTAVITSLRSYRDIMLINTQRDALTNTLNEKNILLKEIHHRVKNNLQVISSLLNMQSMKIKDPDALSMFNESRDRVRSMSIIHEKLYQSDNFSGVYFGDYLNTMVEELLFLYRNDGSIVFDLQIETDFILSIDKAIPCGLIANELITNSLKYAYSKEQQGYIRCILSRDEQNAEIIIEDDGIGIDHDVDVSTLESLGLQLVDVLVSQLGGTYSIGGNKGTRTAITFPICNT